MTIYDEIESDPDAKFVCDVLMGVFLVQSIEEENADEYAWLRNSFASQPYFVEAFRSGIQAVKDGFGQHALLREMVSKVRH